MAVPVIETFSTGEAPAYNETQIDLPVGVEAGDLLLLVTSFAVGGEYAGSEEFLNVPGITRDASSHTISVQYKVATASEPSSYVVKRLTTGSFKSAWYQSVLFRISGVDPVNPFDGVATNIENGAAKNNGIFPSGVSTSTTDALVLAVVSAYRHSGYASGTISNWVLGWPEAYDDNIVSSITRPGLAVAYFTQATPGALPGGLQASGQSDVQKTLSYIALRSDTATEPPPPPPWDGPFYEALSSGQTDNTSTGSLTLPSGTEAGDLLLFLGDCDGVAGFTTLSGFQDLHGGPVAGAAGSSHRGGWQYRIADGTEPASYSVGFHSGSERAAFSLLRYSNVDPDNPIRASATKVGGKNQIVEFPAGLSADVDDCLIVGSIAVESGNSGSPIVPDVNWPSGWTEVYDNFGGPPGGGDASASAAAAVFTMDSAGSIPAESATITGGNTYWISSYIAIAPAPSSSGDTHDFGSISLEFSAPEITVTGFSQVHDLGSVSLSSASPALELNGFSQVHEFGAVELQASSVELSATGFSVTVPSVTYDLGSISVEFGTPEIEVGAFIQDHALSAVELEARAPVVALDGFTQLHEFGAAEVALQVPEVELSGFAQVHEFGSVELLASPAEIAVDGFTTFDPSITQELGSISIVFAAPEITVEGFSQVHNLGVAEVAAAPAELQSGAFNQHHEFGDVELEARAPVVALDGFTQVHEFGAVTLTGSAPEVEVGAFSVVVPTATYELGSISIELQPPEITMEGFSQVHNLGAVEVAVEPAKIQCGAFTQHHEFGASQLEAHAPVVTLDGFSQVHEFGSLSLEGSVAEMVAVQFNTFNPGATPLERIAFVPAETRVAFVGAENRTANVEPEDRALVL
ncbi:hypothetical protein ACQU0X_14540 [Pseudovibrio ascidiaceicola]|uniref:hypothetical protein n=1 Tax=Pseudovibrio ascidiaceicola TaxID=285279 RepID=UPI003D364AAA